MNRNSKPNRIWAYTDSLIGRNIGLALAILWTFGGLLMLCAPASWLASTAPLYLLLFAFLKICGIVTLIIGLGTFRDLWRTRR